MVMDAPAVEDEAGGPTGDLLMARAREIAGWLGVEASEREAEVARVSALEGATADAVVFAVDAATLEAAGASKAGVILANTKLKGANGVPVDDRVIWVRDARYAFAVVASRLAGKTLQAGTHPTAVVGR